MDDPGSIIAALAARITTATTQIPAGSIILYLLLILFSAYFSGTEISFASVNRIHLMSNAAKGSKGAERALTSSTTLTKHLVLCSSATTS